MYQEHSNFQPPEDAAILWRYMDFTKFVSLLETQSLFFARADKLGDPFEGAFSKVNVALRPTLYEGKIPATALQQFAAFVKETRRFTTVNCWHEANHESAAMWKLYSRERDGIAVKTNFKSLSRSFTCNESIFIGKVNYVDYDRTFIPEASTFFPYLHKRHSFEHEREVRAMTQDLPSHDGKIDLSQKVDTTGTYYTVNLALLVQEVIVAPYADDWFLKLVQSVTSRYGLKTAATRSRLAEPPTWG